MHRREVRILAGLLGLIAAVRLGRAFLRLVLESGPSGAVDLLLRHEETSLWFAGGDVYGLHRLTYPPATYALLFPALGWSNSTTVRWLWAGVSVLLCLVLVRILWEACGLQTGRRRTLGALLVLSMTSTSVTVGNGQLGLVVLGALLATILALEADRPRRPWWPTLLLPLALIKPSSSLPFLWLFPACGRTFPLIGGLLFYVALSLFSSAFQGESLMTLLDSWFQQTRLNLNEAGYANLDRLLTAPFVHDLQPLPSLLILLAGGLWVLVYRAADPWILAGVLAVVARLWTYHQIYDDLVLVPALIALYRHLGSLPGRLGQKRWEGIVLVLSIVSLIAPGDLRLLVFPWGRLWEFWQVGVWLALLFCLVRIARQQAKQARAF